MKEGEKIHKGRGMARKPIKVPALVKKGGRSLVRKGGPGGGQFPMGVKRKKK